MARFTMNAGILLVLKSKIANVLYPAFCTLCLVSCILYLASCFASSAVAQPEDRVWIPLTEDAQIQSYATLCRAIYWEKIGNYPEAKRQLEAAIRLNPRSSFLYAKLAEIWFTLRDYRGALKACSSSLDLNPDNADAHYLLGLLNYIRRDPRSRQAAINEFRTATELDPEHRSALYHLSSLLYEDEDYSGAAVAYAEIVKLVPYDPKLRNKLGVSYFRSGEPAKAIKEFNAAVRLRRDYLEPHFHLAYLYAGQSRNKEAIEECLTVLKQSPQDPNMNLLLAEIYVTVGEFDKAIPRAKRALRSRDIEKSTLAEANYRLAAAYKEKGEVDLAEPFFQKSIDLYKEILEEDQGKISTHYEIAMVYDAKGDLDLAERHLREYIKLDPDEPNVQNFLGYTLLQHDVNLDEAVALIKKAVAMEPENGAFRDSLGWAYFKLGDLDEAIVELERAAELMPSDSEIREHLGEVYLKKGGDFVEKAVLEWEKALEMKPKNTALQQRLSELRRSLGQTENTEGGTEGTKER